MSGDLGNSYNIDIWGLLIALGMVAAAAIISELMHMGIGRTLMWSACRALVQLCAMGFIIGYVIRSNSVWMVFALMTVMLIAAVQIVMSRARGIPKGLAGPIFLSPWSSRCCSCWRWSPNSSCAHTHGMRPSWWCP